MASIFPSLPEEAFDEVVASVIDRFGPSWTSDAAVNIAFVRGATGVLHDADGLHLIGEPEREDGALHFNVWVDVPVDDLMVADDLAFGIFARLAGELFLSARVIEERGVRYRFLTGSGLHGHVGSIHLIGPHAAAFVATHRLKWMNSSRFNA